MNIFPMKRKQNNSLSVFDPFDQIQQEINELMSFPFPYLQNSQDRLLGGQWVPAVDMIDQKDQLIVRVDLPGLQKENINVSIEEGFLKINGEKIIDKTQKNEELYIRSERFYGKFQRGIKLPSSVDSGKVKAVFKDGVLDLTLIKKEESKPKNIKIDII